MSPAFVSDNPSDSGFVYSIEAGKRGLVAIGGISAADCLNLAFCQFDARGGFTKEAGFRVGAHSILGTIRTGFRVQVHRMCIATKNRFRVGAATMPVLGSQATFHGRISYVEGISTCKQMVRSDASAICNVPDGVTYITTMADKRLFGRRLTISDNVGKSVSGDSSSLNRETTVAVPEKSALPEPTLAGLINVRPEALNVLCGKLRVHDGSPSQSYCATPRGVSALPRLSLGDIITQVACAKAGEWKWRDE